MKGILLIAWLILFPPSGAINDYLNAKRRKMFGKDDYSEEVQGISSLIAIIFYILMAIFIYRNL